MSLRSLLKDAQDEVREAFAHYEEQKKWHRKFCQVCIARKKASSSFAFPRRCDGLRQKLRELVALYATATLIEESIPRAKR